ncbi:MAG: hypothetical protein ACJAS1_002889 [Oleiphilaceae bacterium]|jgi:hypothetical protein
MLAELPERTYRNIYIVESRSWWESCRNDFSVSCDLVLTYDFGLKKDIESLGGTALFFDHLVNSKSMQESNFLIYKFFEEWNLDKNGEDLFSFRDVSFGFSFRIDIWNDYVYFMRIRLCMEELHHLDFDTIYIGSEKGMVELVASSLGLPYQPISPENVVSEGYYFPIFRYMHENTRSFSLKSKLKDWYMLFQGSLMKWVDSLLPKGKIKPLIFIQEYHPTRKILEYFRDKGNVRVLVERTSATSGLARYITERSIPLWGRTARFEAQAETLMQNFRQNRCAKLKLSNGSDASEFAYKIIEKKLLEELPKQIRILNNIINYVEVNSISLEVLIANIGRVPTLLDCVIKQRKIPSFLIINGLLGPAYSDESKYATMINGYSESIKENYFTGMDNIVCLGDPRMDAYAPLLPRRGKSELLTVTIGASGFNPVDLNSYVAVEFDFIHDVLQALNIVKEQGLKMRIVIKVRPNGYLEQYKSFVEEYFPCTVDEIIDSTPMRDVLETTDFFISIYSQTLFEASCMGIPALYYRKDTEVMDPPFDGKSELVTVDNVDDLVVAVGDAYARHSRFDSFLDRSVMEKYIGPLDGKNLDRNIRFIESMLVNNGAGV